MKNKTNELDMESVTSGRDGYVLNLGKRELIDLLLLYSECYVAVIVL